MIPRQYYWFALSLAAVFDLVNSEVYHVAPDDDKNTSSNIHNLQYYISHSSTYFASHTRLQFRTGQYYLNTSIVLKNIRNFTMEGTKPCSIKGAVSVSIVVYNVTNFKLSNIDFQFANILDGYKISSFKLRKLLRTKIARYAAALVLYHCKSVQITSTEIMTNAGIAGLAVVNIMGNSNLTLVQIKVNCSQFLTKPTRINGIVFHYYNVDMEDKSDMININFGWITNTTIKEFSYHIDGSCPNSTHYAINVTVSQQSYNSYIFFQDAIFQDLMASSILYYQVNTCKSVVESRLFIRGFVVVGNVGTSQLRMFYLMLYNALCSDDLSFIAIKKPVQQYNQISFKNCKFINNTNIESMIYIEPASSQAITGYVTIRDCEFSGNRYVHLINAESKRGILWQITHFMVIGKTRIHSNTHDNGKNLVSITNGMMSLEGPIFISNNSYYRNIIKLQMSTLIFRSYIEVVNNHARQILEASEGSYQITQL